MLLGWCTRIGWALAQRSNGPGCSAAHVSCFANSPTLCRKCHSRVCACGVKNAGYHSPPLPASVRESLVCLALLTREVLHSRGMSNETLSRPLSPVSEQCMTVPDFWRSAFVWSVACGATCNKGICRAAEDCCGSKCDRAWVWFSRIWGAVWSLALIKILNLSRCVEWPFGVSEISE